MKKIRILHSNDIHADFFSNEEDGHSDILSLECAILSHKNENTLYFIAGDVLTGSMIDMEYKGISSFELLNSLAPDLMCVGNHEFDYGPAWPLLLEKVADFPLVCANAYIQGTSKRLFKPYQIFTLNGLTLLVIGLLTDSTEFKLKQQKSDHLIDIKEASNIEVEKVLSLPELKEMDIDLTICLTHLGHKEDVELAKSLKEKSGIDIIIGGHSHTLMNEPILENGILIVQAGSGADHLGCFDIIVNEENNNIEEFTWKLLNTSDYMVTNTTALSTRLSYYKNEVDKKYNKLLATIDTPLWHKDRSKETSAGNFISDVLLHAIGLQDHIVFTHGGFTRTNFIDTQITLKAVNETWPFTDGLHSIEVQGKHVKELLRKNVEQIGSDFFCCMSSNINIIVQNTKIAEITHNDSIIDDDAFYSLVFSSYTLDMMTANSFIDEMHSKNKKLIIPNTNQAIMNVMSDDFKYSIKDRISFV